MKQCNPTRRDFLRQAAFGLSALTFSSCTKIDRLLKKNRPNILFALADDWGWPHAGAYGDTIVNTPNFDRIAREGVLFEHAFVSSPSCTPCRNSILTGQQFFRLKEGANLWSTLNIEEPNFMFLLRDHGYEIGHWRKAWGPGDYKLGGYTEHPCGPESSFEKFLENRDESKPFCFWFGTPDPHRPYKAGSGKKSGIDVDEVRVPEFLPNHETVRSDMADYYFEVQRWDSDVGKALDLLRQSGELENTLVVMSGDHGMPFPRCKGNLYDWGVRVPLAARWGNEIRADRKLKGFVSLTDLAPTFLEAAGVRIPESMTGKSLLPMMTSENGDYDSERASVVFGRERHVPAQQMPSMVGYPSRAIRVDRWLLILNLEPERWPAGVPEEATHSIGSFADCDDGPAKQFIVSHRDDKEIRQYYDLCFSKRPAVELYDCKKDPDQVINLADCIEYKDVIRSLRKRLTEYLTETEDPRFTDTPVRFDVYPYTAGYLKQYLKNHGY